MRQFTIKPDLQNIEHNNPTSHVDNKVAQVGNQPKIRKISATKYFYLTHLLICLLPSSPALSSSSTAIECSPTTRGES